MDSKCQHCGKTGLSMAVVCGCCGQLSGEPQKLKGEPPKWSLENGMAVYSNRDAGVTEVYSENGLREAIKNYLSDESRTRFSEAGFCDNKMFIQGLEHLITGLKLINNYQ